MNKHSHHSHHSRGQSTIEFALVLPIAVVCFGILAAVLSACLTTLRLNDIARLAARSAATSRDISDVQQDVETMCKCSLRITSNTHVVTVRASHPFTLPVIGLSLVPIQLSAESFAMKEPTVVFQAPVPSPTKTGVRLMSNSGL